MEQLNIYQKLALIGKPAEVVQKNRQGFGYRYADREAIYSKITGLMKKYKVSLIPRIVPGTASAEPYHYVKTKTTKDGKVYEEHVNEVIVKAEMEWTWVNNEDPEDRITIPWFLVGSQSDVSQAFGTALSYADRYFIMEYFHVTTTDNTPEEYRRAQQEAEKEEDRLIAEKITDEIHKMVSSFLAEHPEMKKRVMEITKKYAKEDGKPTTNYFAIDEPSVAEELKNALQAEFEK